MATNLTIFECPDARTAPNLQAITNLELPYSATKTWNKVRFYEHVELRPSVLLRLVLPVPMGTTGCHGKPGDTSRCLYSDGGYLTKRMTRIDEGECVQFEIIEQSIRYHNHVKLLGGSIRVIALSENSCRVEMVTHYRCKGLTRWLAGGFVYHVVKAMHRLVLKDMQFSLER